MRTALLLCLIAAVLAVVLKGCLGGEWRLTATKDLTVYKTDSVPLRSAPILLRVNAGKSLKLEKCIFDKSDAYLQVSTPLGSGYVFDTGQIYDFSWELEGFPKRARERGLFFSINCLRLKGQFGVAGP